MIEEGLAFLKKTLLWKEYFEEECLEKFLILRDFDAESNYYGQCMKTLKEITWL